VTQGSHNQCPSKRELRRIISRYFDALTVHMQVALASGCHLTRQADTLIAASVGPDRPFSTLEGFASFSVASRWPASPQVMGVAVK
jgi:hypothetical protein